MGDPFQLFSPEMVADPYPFYAQMRRERVSRIEPGGFWALSRHADVVAAFRATDAFSSAGFVQAFEPPWVGYNPGAHTMLSLDPPAHTPLRGLVNRAFASAVLERMRPELTRLVDGVVARLAERGEVEVVSEMAVPITAGMIGQFLTLDPDVHARLKEWSDALSSVTPVPMGPDHERVVKTAIAEMTRYVREVVEARRRAPGEDMVSVLVNAEVEGQRLGDEELVAFLYLLIVAGLETTVNLISKSFVLLTGRRDVAGALRAAPERIPRFIEEMLRYDPPTHSLFRFTTRDVPVGDTTVPGGAVVMLMLASANRDPERFMDPDAFNLERDTQGALAFGYGAHACIGAALARMEARALLDATLRAFPDLERVEPRVEYRHTLTVRGPGRFPMRAVRA